MSVHQTKTFQSGNSVAVRLPKELGFPAGIPVKLERYGDGIRISPVRDKETTRKLMQELIDDLDAIGRPNVIEEREPFEYPDRQGLF